MRKSFYSLGLRRGVCLYDLPQTGARDIRAALDDHHARNLAMTIFREESLVLGTDVVTLCFIGHMTTGMA
jgi:hypothetical protein